MLDSYICQELWGAKALLTVQNDNTAAISIVSGDSTNWRSRHLASDRMLFDKRSGTASFLFLTFLANVSDAGTKSLPFPRLKLLRNGREKCCPEATGSCVCFDCCVLGWTA